MITRSLSCATGKPGGGGAEHKTLPLLRHGHARGGEEPNIQTTGLMDLLSCATSELGGGGGQAK